MLFNSLEFLIFLIAVLTLYYIIPKNYQWLWLLAASLFFYLCWNPPLILLLLFTIAINYATALFISKSQNDKARKAFLVAGMLLNLGLLFVFKYLNFLTAAFLPLLSGAGILSKPTHILLPMGISFYTFQAAAYTIDVYRKRIRPEQNFLMFTLFISFFPQLVAGPIERTQSLLPQLKTAKYFNINNIIAGGKIALLGLFKKVVIADRAAIIVNTIYGAPAAYHSLHLIIATIAFTFQIYGDFSGYSDIAVGCAKMLGIDLMANFKQPYFAKSIREFWRRWHISLSGWFKDYLYIPLGGSRGSRNRYYRNLMVTFMVSGAWHGANWTFIIWGALHGFYQIFGHKTRHVRMRLKRKLHIKEGTIFARFSAIAATFTLTAFAWIFFRADTVLDALLICQRILTTMPKPGRQVLYTVLLELGLNVFECALLAISVLVLWGIDILDERQLLSFGRHKAAEFAFYYVLAVFVLIGGVYYGAGAFIYFQF